MLSFFKSASKPSSNPAWKGSSFRRLGFPQVYIKLRRRCSVLTQVEMWVKDVCIIFVQGQSRCPRRAILLNCQYISANSSQIAFRSFTLFIMHLSRCV
ncbi:unnamed protein product [Ixodes pacificus]